jgi:hypothetical protein
MHVHTTGMQPYSTASSQPRSLTHASSPPTFPPPSPPGEMPSIVLFPILPFIMEVGLVVYWVSVTAVLYSAGDATPNYRSAATYEPYTFKDLMLAVSGQACCCCCTAAAPVPGLGTCAQALTSRLLHCTAAARPAAPSQHHHSIRP